jgi:hypothetical protein
MATATKWNASSKVGLNLQRGRAWDRASVPPRDAEARNGWLLPRLGFPVARGLPEQKQFESLTLRHPLACGLVVLITGRAYQGFLGGVHD